MSYYLKRLIGGSSGGIFVCLSVSKKLYVGNLPYTTTNADMQSWFSEYGAVEKADVLMDKMTGRSRGFGFVEMTNDAEAQAAIDGLNGQDKEGRKLVVNEARPMADRPPRRSFGGGSGGGGGGFGGGRGGFGGGRGGDRY